MSIKIAKTHNPVIDLIKDRWSARSFADNEITQNELETILEAGTWAFSSNNAQPWRFIYSFRKDNSFIKFHDCLMKGNQFWTKDAAVLIAVVCNKNNADGSENIYAYHDVGAANATLMLQALSMGIYGQVMGGFHRDKAKDLLNIDSNNEDVVVFIALGFLDSPEKLQEPFKTRELTERTRKSVKDVSMHFS